MKNKILPYNPELKELAQKLRQQGVLSEVLFWKRIKGKALGVEFHRQVPIDNYIVDFYCHELMLAVEIDGASHDDESIANKDEQRQQRLEELGVKILRFTDREVKKNLNGIIFALKNYIDELNIPLPPFKGGIDHLNLMFFKSKII